MLRRSIDRVSAESASARPVELALAIQADGELRPDQLQLDGAHLAAHQRSQAELDAQRLGAQAAGLALRANRDVAERDLRERQDAGIDVAADAHLHADQPAGLGFEEGAMVVPIDEMRPDQRRQQRQDQSNRKAQQRRLHDGSGAGPARRCAARTSRSRLQRLQQDRRARPPADRPAALPMRPVWRRICVRQLRARPTKCLAPGRTARPDTMRKSQK